MKPTIINPVTGKTIIEKTFSAYLERGRQLLQQYAASKGAASADDAFMLDFSPSGFREWLIGRRNNGDVAKSSWRQYKQSACFLFYSLIEQGHPHVTREDLEALKNEPSSGASKAGRKTSANKKKGFDGKERQVVEAFLKKCIADASADKAPKYQYAPDLYDFIHGNLHIGLRPSEYAFATLRGKQLTVRNGKHSDGR